MGRILGARQKRFVRYNSLSNPQCVSHITNVMKTSGIDDYEIEKFNGMDALRMRFGKREYIVVMNEFLAELKLYLRNTENHRVMLISQPGEYIYDSSWYDIAQFVKDFEEGR